MAEHSSGMTKYLPWWLRQKPNPQSAVAALVCTTWALVAPILLAHTR